MIAAVGILSALFVVLAAIGAAGAYVEEKDNDYLWVALLFPFIGVAIAFLAGVYSHLA